MSKVYEQMIECLKVDIDIEGHRIELPNRPGCARYIQFSAQDEYGIVDHALSLDEAGAVRDVLSAALLAVRGENDG